MKLNTELLNRIDELGVFGALDCCIVCVYFVQYQVALLGRFTRRVTFDISNSSLGRWRCAAHSERRVLPDCCVENVGCT